LNDRSERNRDRDILAVFPGFVGAFAVRSTLGPVVPAERRVLKRMGLCIPNHVNMPAPAAVAAIRMSLGLERLAFVGMTSVAARTGLDFDDRFIDKHSSRLSLRLLF
jgi:hypothetical protein